jgi:hypothetical protein
MRALRSPRRAHCPAPALTIRDPEAGLVTSHIRARRGAVVGVPDGRRPRRLAATTKPLKVGSFVPQGS